MFWKKKPKKTKREQILEQAHANIAAKREEIGDDALDKIRMALTQHENSPLVQAKKKIAAMDQDKFRDNIKFMMREGKDD